MISGNMVGSYSQLGKTFIIEDENGNELIGVVTGSEMLLTADAATDIREGKVAVTDAGIVEGSKKIPAYETCHGFKVLSKDAAVTLSLPTLDVYDYTIFHGIICDYNTSITNSTAAQQIVLYDSVFNVQSSDIVANVEKDHDTKSIMFNITNNSGKMRILRYITYKEII